MADHRLTVAVIRGDGIGGEITDAELAPLASPKRFRTDALLADAAAS